MKAKLLLLTIGLLTYGTAKCQSFVNTSNEWYLDDCCIIFIPGEIDCTTYDYYFGEIVEIGGLDYCPLITNNSSPIFPLGEYYREMDGKVFLKLNLNEAEFLIYDFNAGAGEQFEVGEPSSPLLLEVISIDSVTLNSGEKGKRIELGDASNLDIRTHWMEGIGSELATMNTRYMFSLDCWNNLNCYHKDGSVEYEIGNCQLTNTTQLYATGGGFTMHPNPGIDELIINSDDGGKVVHAELTDLSGRTCILINESDIRAIDVSELKGGIYWVNVVFQNGAAGALKFIKN